MEIGPLSGEPSPENPPSNFNRQDSTPAGDALSMSSSLREVAELAAAKEAAVKKSSSFGLLALQDKLSFRHWSMIDATSAEIELLVADVVAYKCNVASRTIARLWRRYSFLTRAETLIGTSASTTRSVEARAQTMQLQEENAQVKMQPAQHEHWASTSASSHADIPGFEQPSPPEGCSSRPIPRSVSDGMPDSHGGNAPDCATGCNSFERKITWI